MTDAQIALQVFAGYADHDLAILDEFANPDAKPEPGFVIDFIGSRIRASSLWRDARKLEGTLLNVPIPSDFHAEAIEWIGLLKSVRSARDQYVAMELGAGFGPWIVAGGLTAKRRGLNEIRLYAVEGDPQHFRFLNQHLKDNGFSPEEHVLLQAAVGAVEGLAAWPVLDEAGAAESWGNRPIGVAGDYAGRSMPNTQPVRVIAMNDLVVREPFWDLIHIDVQGDEVTICRSCIDELNARVRWLIVGTHSRKLDGDLLDLLCGAGWLLEHEKPAKFVFSQNPATLEAMTTIDGTQVWRNPRFIRPGQSLTWFSQNLTSSMNNIHMGAGENLEIQLHATNTGPEPWFGRDHTLPVNIGYRWIDEHGHALPLEGNRAPLDRDVVAAGTTCCGTLTVTAPPQSGSYRLLISMVQEGIAWFHERGAKSLTLPATIRENV